MTSQVGNKNKRTRRNRNRNGQVPKEVASTPAAPQKPKRPPGLYAPTKPTRKDRANMKKKVQREARQGQRPFENRTGGKTPIDLTELARRADPRVQGKPLDKDFALSSQSTSIQLEVPIAPANITNFCAAIVTRALEKGFQAKCQNPSDPWYAYVYLNNVLTQYISGGVRTGTTIPYSALCFAQAFEPKTVPFSNGSIAYAPSISAPIAEPIWNPIIGLPGFGNRWLAGVIDDADKIAFFPTVKQPSAYSEPLGARAYQSMCTFFQDIIVETEEVKNPNKPVSLDHETPLRRDKDCSAFSFSIRAKGLGAQGVGTGGFKTTLASEVEITRPIFAAGNAASVLGIGSNREDVRYAGGQGDAFFLGGAISSWLPEECWREKRFVKMHAVDFMQFASVLLNWVQIIVSSAAADPASTAEPEKLACPLTIQEILLLLRNTMMECFKETQNSVQSSYPAVPLGNNDNAFVPFIASTGTCFIDPVPFNMPHGLVENMRALRAIGVHRVGSDHEWWVPVLGKKRNDAFDFDAYTYTVGEETFNTFKDPALLYQRKVAGGKVAPLAEPVIDLVDGEAPGGYVAINSPTRLSELASMWNVWLTQYGLINYSCTMAVMGADAGPNVLRSINATRTIIPQVEVLKDETVSDPRRAKKIVRATPFDGFAAVQDSSQSYMVGPAYEQITSIWILPYSDGVNFGTPLNWQIVSGETYSQTLTTENTGVVMADKLLNFATKMTRGKLTPQAEWDIVFTEATKNGDGGALSGILNFLIPGAGDVISKIV